MTDRQDGPQRLIMMTLHRRSSEGTTGKVHLGAPKKEIRQIVLIIIIIVATTAVTAATTVTAITCCTQEGSGGAGDDSFYQAESRMDKNIMSQEEDLPFFIPSIPFVQLLQPLSWLCSSFFLLSTPFFCNLTSTHHLRGLQNSWGA